MQDWRRSSRHEDAMNEVHVKWICVLHAKFTILKINYMCVICLWCDKYSCYRKIIRFKIIIVVAAMFAM